MQPLKPKKIPQRKCSGCGEHLPKGELLRVVRLPHDGGLVLDSTGKVSGRGAYLCKNPKCLLKAKKANRLGIALCVEISEEVYAALEKEMESLCQ